MMSQTGRTDMPDAKPTRRVPRGARRRQELAVVAEQVFAEHGYVETTMQMIASKAGASKETLYRHFQSKEDLFGEIVRAKSALFWGDAGVFDSSKPPIRVLTCVVPIPRANSQPRPLPSRPLVNRRRPVGDTRDPGCRSSMPPVAGLPCDDCERYPSERRGRG